MARDLQKGRTFTQKLSHRVKHALRFFHSTRIAILFVILFMLLFCGIPTKRANGHGIVAVVVDECLLAQETTWKIGNQDDDVCCIEECPFQRM